MKSASLNNFHDLRRGPDSITIYTHDNTQKLNPAGGGRWNGNGIEVDTQNDEEGLIVVLSSTNTPIKRLHLRWRFQSDNIRLVLGDAWERAYGDLEWRGVTPDRVMPWYFSTWDGRHTNCYGVKVQPGAFCFWQFDSEGISLWADVRSGGVGVLPTGRELKVCEVVCRGGDVDETPFHALQAFCHQMSPYPRLPDHPVYGSNDWYYAYGNNSAKQILEDAHRIVSLSLGGNNKPYAVVDAGWQSYKPAESCEGGEWDRGNDAFPNMPALANDIHKAGAHPGIWIRPLQAPINAPAGWRMVKDHEHLDPTAPETLHKVHEDIARLRSWGFELIKHDFSTFDIFGRWGFQMGASVTGDGWSFAEGSRRTSAEVILDLYRTIREAAGSSLIIGCNTISHLSAGLFEISRIGDDTSGQEWARTRKMGVNCLAFRSVQNGSFYIADPDCVGVTKDVPWEYNKQWLDLLSRSGAMTFVSLNPNAVGSEQERDLRNAFALAANPQPVGEALDWQDTLLPNKWLLMGKKKRYDWIEKDGVFPF